MKNYNSFTKDSSGRALSGLIILAIGIIFFLRSFGLEIPDWIVSWHTILIFVGLYIGFKKNFTGNVWLVFLIIGTYFTLNDIVNFNLGRFYFPIAFIILGLYLILRPRKSVQSQWKKKAAFQDSGFFNGDEPLTAEQSPVSQTHQAGEDKEVVDFVAIFAGTHHKIFSKNFKGGNVTAIFGGCELHMTQADFTDTIVLDVVAIFGGTKLIIPSSWEVKSEITAIFGGVDDKRVIVPFVEGPRKTLIIKGVALFGGVEIKNY
jgi:predicted membrane protein